MSSSIIVVAFSITVVALKRLDKENRRGNMGRIEDKNVLDWMQKIGVS
jgi:hypothetical protein